MHFQIRVVVLALLSLAQSNPTKRARDNEPSDAEPSSKRTKREIISSSRSSIDSIEEVIDNSVNFRAIAEAIIPQIEEWFVPIPLHPRLPAITNSSSIFETLAGYVVESERGISPIGAFISSSDESVTTVELETPALEAEVKFKLCYRASEHDFVGSAFHRLCDRKGATITLVKDSTDKIAAAYNSESWGLSDEFTPNYQGFLASIVEGPEEGGGYVLQKYSANDFTMSITYPLLHGPAFDENTLYISDRCNENTNSQSIIDGNYRGGYAREGMAGREHLFDTEYFRVSEYEVFQVELHTLSRMNAG
jgi:hypothetical protein